MRWIKNCGAASEPPPGSSYGVRGRPDGTRGKTGRQPRDSTVAAAAAQGASARDPLDRWRLSALPLAPILRGYRRLRFV
jgi:hypothetical protein